MEKFGKMFPGGKVPLVTMLSQQMTIAGITDHFYFADYTQFNQDQKQLLAKFMNDERGIPRHRVPECLEIMKYKVPLSGQYVDTVYDISPRPNA